MEVQRSLITAPAPVIFDVGAHVGAVAHTYRQYFPQASIHCFEPFPESFERLVSSREGDPRSYCYQKALASRNGTAFLNANRVSDTNSLLATDERGASYWGTGLYDTLSRVEVETTTADAFCAEWNIPHVDILKLDVQGAELDVLKGAQQLLARQRISIIYSEVILCPTYAGQARLHEYLALLDSHGYDLVNLFNPVNNHRRLLQADFLFADRSRYQTVLPDPS
jgi:FkbM family methyltransferase